MLHLCVCPFRSLVWSKQPHRSHCECSGNEGISKNAIKRVYTEWKTIIRRATVKCRYGKYWIIYETRDTSTANASNTRTGACNFWTYTISLQVKVKLFNFNTGLHRLPQTALKTISYQLRYSHCLNWRTVCSAKEKERKTEHIFFT